MSDVGMDDCIAVGKTGPAADTHSGTPTNRSGSTRASAYY